MRNTRRFLALALSLALPSLVLPPAVPAQTYPPSVDGDVSGSKDPARVRAMAAEIRRLAAVK